MNAWHTLSATEALRRLETDALQGLSAAEPVRRLEEYGPNELEERGARGPWLIIWDQFKSTLVVILVIAVALSAVLGDVIEAIAILAIIILNVLLGFSQEYRAERAAAALKQLAVPTVRVRRDGRVQDISARALVPGDIVLLEAGNLVPADGRVLKSSMLRAVEAALTGESEAVDKITDPLDQADIPLGDRRNMVYMGTIVAAGRGEAVMTATGMATELGHIATLLQTVEREQTPLQRRLNQLGRRMAAAALALVTVIFALGLARGEAFALILLTAVSLAVAAVPEGLPAMVTIALALGAQRMLKRKALIRKLPAVETLGSVTVICSDKTGTLTQNRMTVSALEVAGESVDLTGHQQDTPGLGVSAAQVSVSDAQPGMNLLLAGATLCNDAQLEPPGETPGAFSALGDPTEGALVVAAAQRGLWKPDLEQALPRVDEVPFDSERKRMTTVHRVERLPSLLIDALEALESEAARVPYLVFTKGAVTSLLNICGAVWTVAGAQPLDASWREQLLEANDALARKGMRVLGVAFRPLQALSAGAQGEALERDLIFVGMVGMIDPARPEARDAVQTCHRAGIRTMMITGDHPLTAQYIAGELEITADGQVMTGHDLAQAPAEALARIAEAVNVYARVSPKDKLAIVEALQAQQQIVAMTGDGVNDAPALKKADIGVAMGITGTDVAKEAADMVLLDDNFATIVAAVEEGRVIYDNIRKFIRYLLTTNSAELGVVLLGPLVGMPLPLLPLQILWMNLVTDGLPALALSVEPAERDVMQRPPRAPTESVFARGLGWQLLWGGLLMSLVSLVLGYWFWSNGNAAWQTLVFTTLTLSQMANVLAIRSERASFFQIGLRSNMPLLGAVLLTILLQFALVYIPFLQGVFKTTALSAGELALSLALSAVIFVAVELEKWLARRK